jgi:hypothetical protein
MRQYGGSFLHADSHVCVPRLLPRVGPSAFRGNGDITEQFSRTHACRCGERHHQDVAGLTSLMSHSSLRAPIVPTVRLRRVSRPSRFQRQGRRERGPAGLWSPSCSHSMSLFCRSPFACSLELKPRRHARNRHGQLYCEHQRNRAGSEFGHEVVIRRDGGEAC